MRILFIAQASSLQTAHWLRDLAETGWEIHVFPVDDAPPHPELRHITLHDTMYYPMGRHYLRGLDPSLQVDGIYWQALKPLWKVRGGSKLARRLLRYVRPGWQDPAWRLVKTISNPQARPGAFVGHPGCKLFCAAHQASDRFGLSALGGDQSRQ